MTFIDETIQITRLFRFVIPWKNTHTKLWVPLTGYYSSWAFLVFFCASIQLSGLVGVLVGGGWTTHLKNLIVHKENQTPKVWMKILQKKNCPKPPASSKTDLLLKAYLDGCLTPSRNIKAQWQITQCLFVLLLFMLLEKTTRNLYWLQLYTLLDANPLPVAVGNEGLQWSPSLLNIHNNPRGDERLHPDFGTTRMPRAKRKKDKTKSLPMNIYECIQ